MIDISTKGKGALPDKIDLRNFRFEAMEAKYFPITTEMLPAKYDISDKIQWIKDQGSSGSCGGQAFSYYMEVKSFIRDGKYTKLSAKDLYAPVHLQPEGSRAGDLLNWLANAGIAEENDVSSYENGNPPTEQFMERLPGRSLEAMDRAMQYWTDKTYLTFSSTDITQVKKAIFTGDGCVVALLGNNPCWTTKNGVVTVPAPGTTTWGHFLYLCGYDDSTQLVKAVNSWGKDAGDKGFYYIPYKYFTSGLAYNEWVVVELARDKYTQLMKTITYLKNAIELLKKKLGLR